MKKKLKWLFLLLCLLLGIGAAACFFLYRPAPKVIDETENGQAEEEEKNSGDGEKENSATLNKSVHAYVDDEAEQINAAISDVTWSEGEIFIHFPESADVEIKELQTGEIFWLEGSEDTPLKDTYIGKIASNTQSNGTVILSVTSPQIDEVFDEFYVDEEMGITASQIRSISAVEGVEVTPVDVIGEDFLQTAGRRGEEIEDLTYTRFVKPGISDSDRVILIQAALFCSAISTLLQLFPFIKFGNFQLGSALPVIMGISFAYVPSMQAIAGTYDIATILGAQVVGGVIAIIVGFCIRKIRILFPPLVTGTVVFTIGLSLYPTAVNYMAGGTSSDSYGSWQNWLVAFFTLAVVTGLNHFAKGFLKLASILVGIVAGYILAIPFGLVDLSAGYRQVQQLHRRDHRPGRRAGGGGAPLCGTHRQAGEGGRAIS